jgi:rhamnosyltransferase
MISRRCDLVNRRVPEIVESLRDPLRPEIAFSGDFGFPRVPRDVGILFHSDDGETTELLVEEVKKNRLKVRIEKKLLFRPGVLEIVFSKKNKAGSAGLLWTPGICFLAKAVNNSDNDYFRQVESRHPELNKRSLCEVSFVILAKNEAAHIRRALTSIKKQRDLGRYEIIVLDSGSKDNTRNIALEEGAYIVGIDSQEFGHGKTRNLGVHLARGEFVCFLNGDAIPVNDRWYEGLRRHFANPRVEGACSRQIPRPNCDPLRRWELLNWPVRGESREGRFMAFESTRDFVAMKPEQKRQRILFESVSCMVRRGTLILSPFPDVPFGEDFCWAKRILENKGVLVYDPTSMVEHSHDLYRSLRVAARKAFDDHALLAGTIGPQVEQNCRAYLCHLKEVVRDSWRIVSESNLECSSKVRWLCWAPVVRIASIIGMAVAYSRFRNNRAVRRVFSLVGQIKGS